MTKADNAMEIIAYEMQYVNDRVPQSDIVCIPFEALFFQEYKRIYNECFYEMRKVLDIQPYHFLNAYDNKHIPYCSLLGSTVFLYIQKSYDIMD